jgi:hypothetical protein
MKEQEKFNRYSDREEFAFNEFTKLYGHLFKDYDIFITGQKLVDDNGKLINTDQCTFDAILTHRFTGMVLLFEFKIRLNDKFYTEYDTNGYFLSHSKYMSLIKRKNEIEKIITGKTVKVYYVNFLSTKTLMWRIDNMNKSEIKYSTTYQNKYTAIDTGAKVKKTHILLQSKDAQIFNYAFDQNAYIAQSNNKSKEIMKTLYKY